MEQPTRIFRVKMKYLDKVKVTVLQSQGDRPPQLSSMRSLEKFVYEEIPELHTLCGDDTASSSNHLQIKFLDDDEDWVTVENDKDLESVLESQKTGKFVFLLGTKRRDSEVVESRDGSGSTSGSTSNEVRVRDERRGKRQPCRYYRNGRGHCRNGADCSFAHEQNRNGGAPELPSSRSQNNRGPLAATPSSEVFDFGVWLKQQLEQGPDHNITFLSSDEGIDKLSKLVAEKNLPSEWIDLLVKLLTREELRLSSLLSHTDKIYGLLIGSNFLVQLEGHIRTQPEVTTEVEQIRPVLFLFEELQSRTTGGWKKLPLDDINNVIQQLEESDAKRELTATVNSLIEHRKKLSRKAALPREENESHLLGAEFRNISIIPDRSDLLEVSANLPVNLVGKPYKSVTSFLETHFRLLREDLIDPMRQGITAYRDGHPSRELYIYEQVKLAGYRCGEHGFEYSLTFQDNRGSWDCSKRLLFGSLVCLSHDRFKTSFVFGVVTQNNLKSRGTRGMRYSICIRMNDNPEGDGFESIAQDRIYDMVESTSAYFEAYYHVLKGLQMEDMEKLPFQQYLLDLEEKVNPPLYLLHGDRGDEFDFGSVFPSMKTDIGESRIKVLQEWPEWPSSLDRAQLQALKHGLTKELSIIQGPPGTGKTFLGLLLVRLLLAKFKPPEEGVGDETSGSRRMERFKLVSYNSYRRKGPILVICMTNHALDQFLNGIYEFEPNLIRMGGRSKSSVLQERTLKKLLAEEKSKNGRLAFPEQRIARGKAWRRKADLEEQIRECILKLNTRQLTKQELSNGATEEQIRSLFSVGLKSTETVERWLEGEALQPSQGTTPFEESTVDSDEEPWDWDQFSNKRTGEIITLQQSVSEGSEEQPLSNNLSGTEESEDEDEVELGIQPVETPENNSHKNDDEGSEEEEANTPEADQEEDQNEGEDDDEDEEEFQIKFLLNCPDLWSLNQKQRRILHHHWLGEVLVRNKKKLRELIAEYEKACTSVNQIEEEVKLSLLRKANVVGITTTAAARYRGLLKALNSEILIVEEAAEVLEGHVLASLNSCVKHLVLIGDHLQLRPSTAVYRLGTKHKLDVSMFERLVEGGVEHVTLEEQRRMRPTFARLVKSLYPSLKDHESVSKYENIKGISSNLFFFHHTAEENSTNLDNSSRVNTTEAKLVVELTLYLLKQGCYSAENIAILTMYSGQLMEIRRILKERATDSLSSKYFDRIRKMNEKSSRMEVHDSEKDAVAKKEEAHDITKLLPRVSSVDDFQGEEADIIILSLVRNNHIQTSEGEGTIGFLKTPNRICVALTRAKKGLYIFGNATLLAERSELWSEIVTTLQKDSAVDTKLELHCQNHPETVTVISKQEDFKEVPDGGCNRPCGTMLECGHVCPRSCHPGSHEDVVCLERCRRRYENCEHICPRFCHGSSDCDTCQFPVPKVLPECGHSQIMGCSTAETQQVCQNSCPKILECFHRCDNICGVPCTDHCVQKVSTTLPCGHVKDIPCKQNPDSYSCKEPCEEILSLCGHQCQGNCSRCKMGREHIPCSQKCGKILPCSHACEANCSAPCPPCKKICQKRCVHSRCQLPCCQLCVPCREPCEWQCEHHKCELLCHEICTRPRCDVPCKKLLPCGHPCIGLCGERCPSKCRICRPNTLEFIKQKTLEEFEQTVRFYQLPDCKHLFEVSGLDMWMDGDSTQPEDGSKSAAVKLKQCPQCKTPVMRSARYANVVKRELAKLEEVKQKIWGYDKVRQGQRKLEQGDHNNAFPCFIEALKGNPGLMEAHFGAARALCESKLYRHAAVFLSFIVENSSYASEVAPVLRSTSELDKIIVTSKPECIELDEELALKAIIQLALTFLNLSDFTGARKLSEVVLKRYPGNGEAKIIRGKALDRLI